MELAKKYKDVKNSAETLLIGACVVMTCVGILVFPNSASDGAKHGLMLCADILIPSLFSFMVLSAFIVKSGLASKIEGIMNPITRLLFNLPGCAGSTILLSLIGGYPTGVRGIKALRENEQITDRQAEQMLCFCIGAGPAFVISVIGGGIFKSSQIGCVLFFSQIIASLTLGIISRFVVKSDNAKNISERSKSAKLNVSSALVESCLDSTTGMINMCSFVVLFSSLINVVRQSGILNVIAEFLIRLGFSTSTSESILPLILEITNGSFIAAQNKASPELLSFAIGWAGICVHFQIFSCVSELPVRKLLIILFRLFHGTLAALISRLGFYLFPSAVATFSNCHQPTSYGVSSTPIGCLALVVLCICFLIASTPNILDFTDKKC